MSNWKRTALGSGGGDSPRNVIEAVAPSGYTYAYHDPGNMITTQASGNMFLFYEPRFQHPTGVKRIIGFDPFLNVMFTGDPYIGFQQNQERYSYGYPQMSDGSAGGNNDIIFSGKSYTGGEQMYFIKNTGTAGSSSYNYYEKGLSSTYYNSSNYWTQSHVFRTHAIGDKIYDFRNHPSSGCSYMSYKWPTGNQTSWYSASDIQGINPGMYQSSAFCQMFDPINPASQSTEWLVGMAMPYSVARFFRMQGSGAATTSPGFYASGLSGNPQYYATAAIDRANTTAFMFESDSSILLKWNWSTNSVSTWQITLPSNVNRTAFSNPMIYLNGYVYLIMYGSNNTNGGMFVIRMDASNPTSNTAYRIKNTQGSIAVSHFNLSEGPNSATGETDLLSLVFEYRSNSNGSFKDMIVANLLFSDIPQLSQSGSVGAKLNVYGTSVTVATVNWVNISTFSNAANEGSALRSNMYTGNQGTGFPGMQSYNNHWSSQTPQYGNFTNNKVAL